MSEKFLLDTSILVDYLRHGKTQTRKHPEREYYASSAVQLIVDAIQREAEVFVSVVTVKELLQYPNLSSKEKRRIIVDIPVAYHVLPLTWEIAVICGELSRISAEYRESHIEDCYVAATAIAHELPLYTRNPKDFRDTLITPF